MAPTVESSRRGVEVPLTLLASYLFFLLRRPVSSSNRHYLVARLRGLQSLAGLLEAEPREDLRPLVSTLRRLSPANFSHAAAPLQLLLAAAQQSLVTPPPLVVSHRPPPRWPFPGDRRVLIIFGPAIGIGDEMILFPLPAAIRAAGPEVEIVVMSGYDGLWDRVRAVDRRVHLETHAQLAEALGGTSLGTFDTVIMADFEKPGLTPAICSRPSMRTYIEISLGAQSAVFADAHSGRIHAASLPVEARLNYYEVFDWLLDWLGIPLEAGHRYSGIVERSRKNAGAFRIFVSPFTSKHEPSLIYWTRLLASLSNLYASREIEVVLDAGASFSTERFTSSILRAVGARADGRMRFRIARDPDSRTLSLRGALSEMESSDALICADSYAAHAGPLFGCTTLVIARLGLESWRTPFERSFYFDSEQPLEEILRAIGRILEELLKPGPTSAPLPSSSVHLLQATRRLKNILANDINDAVSTLNGNYDSFKSIYDEAVTCILREHAACPPGLLSDSKYPLSWPEIAAGAAAQHPAELVEHLCIGLARWENTNLHKFLALAAG
jgi:hypothetical protein